MIHALYFASAECLEAAESELDGSFVPDCNGKLIAQDSAFLLNCGDWVLAEDSEEVSQCSCCGDMFEVDDGIVASNGEHFCGQTCARDDGYDWDDSACEWRPEDEIERTGRETLDSYCSINYSISPATEARPFRIGFEVEKEDEAFLNEHNMREYASQADWIAVTDGSLSSYSGFELVSPCYNMADRVRIFEDFDTLADGLDAESSTNCGGHITVSQWGLTGEQLTQRLGDFPALLYAMFPQRLRGTFASPRKKDSMKRTGRKFRAVNVKSECVEFRVFNRVQTVGQLKRRFDLLAWAMKLERPSVADSIADPKSELTDILRRSYSADNMTRVRRLFDSFHDWYNGELVPSTSPAYGFHGRDED